MNVKPLTEQAREQISVEELMRLLLHYFKKIPKDSVPNLLLQLCPIPDGIILTESGTKGKVDWIIKNRSAFAMKFFEAIALLQKRGLIAPMLRVRNIYTNEIWPLPLFLTTVGQQSIIEDDIILLVDNAEEIVKSVSDIVPNLDPTVADFYRESIRACQEGLLLSSCICLGSASERAIHQLAYALSDYAPEHKDAIEGKWLRKNMKDKIDTLWGWIHEIEERDFPTEPCFKDLRSKIDALAHWYRITRNEAGHADREAILPTQKEIELSIHQFRRYVINIFQIIGLFQSGSQKP
ncbi:hypothetical protein FJZ31_16255 [Candidatus Poribacteria bacterium]|nr:hypothetical protein [Candidatus Poribacteria bacterium]